MARSKFLTSVTYLSMLFCLSDSSRFTRNSIGSQTLGTKSGDQNAGNGGENLVRLPRDQYSSSYKVPKHYTIVDPGPGWNPRQMASSFATTNLLPSQGAASDYPYAGSDEDNAVAAGGHGHSQSGWGWGQGQGYKDQQSQVNNSAVGMLGFLSLLALIQNVLRQMQGGAGGIGIGGGGTGGIAIGGGGTGGVGGGSAGGGVSVGGRSTGKRSIRDTSFNNFSNRDSQTQRFASDGELVPYLLNLNRIRDGDMPLDCSSYAICMITQLMSQGMNKVQEEVMSKVISEIIGQIIKPPLPIFGAKSWNAMETKHLNARLKQLINRAVEVASTGKQCGKIFKNCSSF